MPGKQHCAVAAGMATRRQHSGRYQNLIKSILVKVVFAETRGALVKV
jgi:hypothetical protein